MKTGGKSVPAVRGDTTAAKPHLEQGRIGGLKAPGLSPGRLLESGGNAGPR